MNAQKLTQKSLEAIQNAQNKVIEYSNAQIEEEHLFYALMEDADGLISQLLKKMNIDDGAVRQNSLTAIERLPKVSGSGRESGSVCVSRRGQGFGKRREKGGPYERRLCFG